MHVFQAQLPLGPKADEMFSFIGALALSRGNQEAAEICAGLVHNLGAMEITVKVDCLHALCQACDHFRGQPEVLAKIERLIALLKIKPGVILGTLNLNVPTLGMLDHALDDLRKTVIGAAGHL